MKSKYKNSDHKSQCWICGRVYGSSDIRPQWDGVLACYRCWNSKHPDLDPIIAPREDPSVRNASPRNLTYVDAGGVSVWGGNMWDGKNYSEEYTWDQMDITWDEDANSDDPQF